MKAALDRTLGILLALATVAAVTLLIGLANLAYKFEHVTILYLIPVLVAALRWGVMPAIVAAPAGIAAPAFFFYPPIYDFRVQDPDQVIDIVLFVIVAAVTGQLAVMVRRGRVRAEAEHLREALIGSVSHELKTPLAAIVGSTSVLAQAAPVQADERLAARVRVIRNESERLSGDIANLLDDGSSPRTADRKCRKVFGHRRADGGERRAGRAKCRESPVVLVIDDEPQIRRFLRAGFDLEKFTILEEETAEGGLRAATLRNVDLIVLDLNLPDMDGATVVERIRAWSTVPIIVLSVRSDNDDKVRLLETGADDYVVKPFSMAELLARVRTALRRQACSAQGEPLVRCGRRAWSRSRARASRCRRRNTGCCRCWRSTPAMW